VDAGIIYDPCPLLQSSDWVPADSLVVAVPLEPESNRQVRIHAALHKRSPNPALARQFMAVLMSADLGPGEAAAPPAEEEAETPQQAAGAEGE
jgi:ABC-type molybdate transport system substrate-binding protein